MATFDQEEWILEFLSTIDISIGMRDELHQVGLIGMDAAIRRIDNGTYSARDAKEFLRVVHLCDGISCQEYRDKLREHIGNYYNV